MQGEDGVSPLEELIDRSSPAGFDGHSQVGPDGGLLHKTLPAFQRMFELEVSDNSACLVYNNDGVMVLGPIKASIMREILPVFHAVSFPVVHRSAVMRRPDTRSLEGCSSLRRWDGRRRTGR
jgi:hypothetical protein